MEYLPFVNIKQGSDSVHSFSNGNTLPLTQLPFAMTAFAPQTSSESSWFYSPRARVLEGVRITHQPSPWIADYGTLIFMPQKRSPEMRPIRRRSGYRPDQAVLSPHFMQLDFLKSRCRLRLTPAERGAAMELAFDSADDNWLSVLPLCGGYEAKWDACSDTMRVKVDNCGGQNTVGFAMYTVIRFAPGEIDGEAILAGTENALSNADNVKGEMAGMHIKLKGASLHAALATSYISYEQAERNLNREIGERSFEELRENGRRLWESYLSRVEIETENEAQKRTFYSCMYRAFLYPHKAYEPDANGEPVHYSPCDGKTRCGVRYTDNGFWDTCRTCYPFYAIVARDEYREMVRAFVNDYLECGWLPRWPSIGERGCMPSTLIDAVLCDAAVKGLMDRDTMEQAFEGMLKHANVPAPNDDYGRSGVADYVRLGYVPIEAHKESVNLTADAAYGDWCIARIAELLGKKETVRVYDERAKNYQKLFDPETGFMRARFADGEFRPGFIAESWGLDYTEGSAWQNSFAVPHDVEGLAALYGGKEAFLKKIDALFETPPVYEIAGYDSEIHEITEMAH